MTLDEHRKTLRDSPLKCWEMEWRKMLDSLLDLIAETKVQRIGDVFLHSYYRTPSDWNVWFSDRDERKWCSR